jgi:site-specific recombinase XerD
MLVQYRNQENKLRSDPVITPKNKQYIQDFLHDCELGKTILTGQKRQLGPARLLKYLFLLRHLAVWLKKDFDALTEHEMETFVLDLERDRITSKSGKPYRANTKRDLKIALRKFYKWLLGGNETYPPIVRWIDTRDIHIEIPCLRKEEIDRMSELAHTPRDRAILWMLFDSGARAEEFLNTRLRNLEEMKDEHGGKVFRIRIEHSKTKPRTVLLPIASPALKLYLDLHKPETPEDLLFPVTYGNLVKILRLLGLHALNRKVHPHLLRHSSATYYAPKLSRAAFCYRFGWSYGSNMPDRYIDREALTDQESVEAVRTETVQDLKRENTTLKEDLAQVRDQMNQIHTFLNTLTNDPVIVRQIANATERLKQGEKLRELRISLT